MLAGLAAQVVVHGEASRLRRYSPGVLQAEYAGGLERQWPAPAGAGHWRPGTRAVPDQPVVTAVSSTTNEVCNEESSVPVNSRVTVLPAKPDSEYVCCV
jgi:hypothetical protein